MRRQGETYLDVAVPVVAMARLAASFGQFDVPLDTMDGFGRATGSVRVPPTILLSPPARRVLTVYAPGFAEPVEADPDSAPRQAAIIEYARARTASPWATVTERSARR